MTASLFLFRYSKSKLKPFIVYMHTTIFSSHELKDQLRYYNMPMVRRLFTFLKKCISKKQVSMIRKYHNHLL